MSNDVERLLARFRHELGRVWDLTDPRQASIVADSLTNLAQDQHWNGLASRTRVAPPTPTVRAEVLTALRCGRGLT